MPMGGNPQPSLHVPLDGATQGMVGVANGIRRRRRRHRGKPSKELVIATTADCVDNAATAIATPARCSTKSDPLAEAPCEGAGSPVWVGPMFDELIASLGVSVSGRPLAWVSVYSDSLYGG